MADLRRCARTRARAGARRGRPGAIGCSGTGQGDGRAPASAGVLPFVTGRSGSCSSRSRQTASTRVARSSACSGLQARSGRARGGQASSDPRRGPARVRSRRMSTATSVPSTFGLEGDDALATLRETGRRQLAARRVRPLPRRRRLQPRPRARVPVRADDRPGADHDHRARHRARPGHVHAGRARRARRPGPGRRGRPDHRGAAAGQRVGGRHARAAAGRRGDARRRHDRVRAARARREPHLRRRARPPAGAQVRHRRRADADGRRRHRARRRPARGRLDARRRRRLGDRLQGAALAGRARPRGHRARAAVRGRAAAPPARGVVARGRLVRLAPCCG